MKKYTHYFVFAKYSRTTQSTVFREIRPGAGIETGDFVESSLGGYRKTILHHNFFTGNVPSLFVGGVPPPRPPPTGLSFQDVILKAYSSEQKVCIVELCQATLDLLIYTINLPP